MHIRRSTLADAVELARLSRATIRTINAKNHAESIFQAWSGGNTASAYRKMLKERIQYVAIEKDQIIGFTDLLPDGELTSLYVHPKYIGKGVGKKLLAFIEDVAKEIGIKTLRSQSSENAKDFYIKHGYTIIKPDVWVVEGAPPMRVYQMEKKL